MSLDRQIEEAAQRRLIGALGEMTLRAVSAEAEAAVLRQVGAALEARVAELETALRAPSAPAAEAGKG